MSHETIYLSLLVQTQGALRRELTRDLRTRRATRRPLGHVTTTGQGRLRDTMHISERSTKRCDEPLRPQPFGHIACRAEWDAC